MTTRHICLHDKACMTLRMNMTPVALGLSPTSKVAKSHEIVRQGLRILENLTHRGAVGADPCCRRRGRHILLQIPDDLFLRSRNARGLGITLPDSRAIMRHRYAVPASTAQDTRQHCETTGRADYQPRKARHLIGWREVPDK